MAVITDGADPSRHRIRAGTIVNGTGALISVALVAGLGVWGYRLLVRDATGVPVVRALEGPMREAPPNPGGELVPNMGLAVNAVAAQGEAAPTEERLVLAPAMPDLTEEDLMHVPTAEIGEVRPDQVDPADAPSLVTVPPGETMTDADVLAMADRIAAGGLPLTPEPAAEEALTEATEAPVDAEAGSSEAVVSEAAPLTEEAATDAAVAEAAGAVAADATVIDAAVPGVSRSVRPPGRPAALSSVTLAAAVTAAPETLAEAGPRVVDVTTEPLPVGTVLVQLGAFESAELAGTEWSGLATQFAEFMEGRERVVQEATSGGRTFYRLRATGFTDLADARRFCSALVAEDASCIPVVVR